MLDLSLTKIALIGVVALVVIGPDKLPKVARMAGSLYGRAQRYIHKVKTEISSEIELEELLKLERDAHEAALNFGNAIADELSGARNMAQSAENDRTALRGLSNGASYERKARNFRKKKLSLSSEIPSWYKHVQIGGRGSNRVLSCAGRIGKFGTGGKRAFSFH